VASLYSGSIRSLFQKYIKPSIADDQHAIDTCFHLTNPSLSILGFPVVEGPELTDAVQVARGFYLSSQDYLQSFYRLLLLVLSALVY